MTAPRTIRSGIQPRWRRFLWWRFLVGREAIAAVEFALIAPALFTFMLGGVEVTRYVNTSRQLTNLANSVASLVAARTSDVGYLDLMFVFNSAVVTFPPVLKDSVKKGISWKNDITINLSSIAFTPTVAGCTSNCTYNAAVRWSANLSGQGSRSCTTPPIKAADTDTPSFSTLPQDVYNSGTLIVADIVFTYTPLVGGRFFSSQGLTIRRSVYLQPRYKSEIKNVAAYTANGVATTGPTYNCPSS